MIQIYFSSRVGESPDQKQKNLFVLVRCSNTPPCGATELYSRVTRDSFQSRRRGGLHQRNTSAPQQSSGLWAKRVSQLTGNWSFAREKQQGVFPAHYDFSHIWHIAVMCDRCLLFLFSKVCMVFSRDFINAMDETGSRQMFPLSSVSRLCAVLKCHRECTGFYYPQIIGTSVPAENWEQCLFTVWWSVQSPEATDDQPHHPANCLLSSAWRQNCWQGSMVPVTGSRPEECRRSKSLIAQDW